MGSEVEASSTVRHTEPEALGNVAAVLQLCAAGALRCSEKTYRPSAATVRTVAEALVGGDFYPDEAIASFAWPLLLQAGGLARLDGTRLALTPKGRKALGQPAHEVIRGLWERWPRHAPIDELSRVEQIKGQKAAAAVSGAGPRRQAVAAAVALCPPDEWIAVDELFAEMRHANLSPTVARSERGLWKLYLCDPEYGSLGYDGFHDWPILEGRYTLAVLFEYAAPLGLLDVDYVPPAHARDDFRHMWGADWIDALSRYDGLCAVRLTPLGAYATGLTSTYDLPPPRARTAPCRFSPTTTSWPPPTWRPATGSSSTRSPRAPPTRCGRCPQAACSPPWTAAARRASSAPSSRSARCTPSRRPSARCSPTSRPVPGRSATSASAASSSAPTPASPRCSRRTARCADCASAWASGICCSIRPESNGLARPCGSSATPWGRRHGEGSRGLGADGPAH